MAALTERLQVLIEAVGGGAIKEFQKVGSEARRAHDKVAQAQGDSAQSAGRLGKALNSLGISSATALKAGIVAGAIAGGLAIRKFVNESVHAYVQYGAEVRRLQRITLATAEDSSRLAVSFHTLGIDATRGGTAIFRFLKNIDTSGGALRSFGVEVVRNKQGVTQTVPTLLNLADAYSKTTSPSKRAALAAAAFGARIGTELLPALARGRSGMEALLASADRFGLVMSQKDLQATLDYTLATRHLGESVEGLKIQTGRSFVGVGTKLAEVGTTVVIGLQKEASGLGRIISHVPGVKRLSDAFHDVATSSQHAGAALKGPLAALPEFLQKGLESQQSQVALLLSNQRATLAVESAKHNLVLAEKALATARAGGNNTQRNAIQLAREERDAQHGLRDAKLAVADAQAKLTSLLQGPSNKDLIDANFEQRDAQLALTEAQQAFEDAIRDEHQTLTSVPRAILTVEQAKRRLADANNLVSELERKNASDIVDAQSELERAQDRLVDAQDRVTEAMKRTASEAPDVQGAILTVKQAQIDLALAMAASRDASDVLNGELAKINDIDASNVKTQLTGVLELLRANGLSADEFLGKLREIEVIGESHAAGQGHLEVAPGLGPEQSGSESLWHRITRGIVPGFGKHLPGFASGGVVDGPIGAPQLAVVHGGEHITPVGGGGQMINLTINAAPGQGVHDLAIMVRDELLKLKRRNVTAALS